MKDVVFVGASLDDLRTFPDDARREAGFEIDQVQRGEDPSDWKPLKIVGPNVREIRIHTRDAFRIVYVAAFEEAIYVLHAFQKKTQKTALSDIQIASQRLKGVVAARKRVKPSWR